MAIRLDGSAAPMLAGDAAEPVYSPDGTRLACSRGKPRTSHRGRPNDGSATELAVADADGSGRRG